MQVVRQRPFTFNRFFGPEFDRLFETLADGDMAQAWVPAVDVFEEEGALVARFEVPGFSSEDLNVTLEDGVLTVAGERAFEVDQQDKQFHRREMARGLFKRALHIGDAYDPERVTATYKDGILEVRIPKRPEVLPRKIEISTEG